MHVWQPCVDLIDDARFFDNRGDELEMFQVPGEGFGDDSL